MCVGRRCARRSLCNARIDAHCPACYGAAMRTRFHSLWSIGLLGVSLVGSACSGAASKSATVPTAIAGAQTETASGSQAGGVAAPAPAVAMRETDLLPAPEVLAKPLAGDPMAVTIHRLSNGMTVYISPDRTSPSIQAWTVVRAGAGSETPQSTGLAHYLEHMLFKGSSRLGTKDFAREKPHLQAIAALYAELRKPGADVDAIRKKIDDETQLAAQYAIPNEFDRVRGQLGITGTNAFTSNDTTVYVGTVPAPKLAAWAALEAERFIDPQFRLFWTELEAVYEEKNLDLDRPEERITEAVQRAVYPGHAYGYSSIIGEVEHLKLPAYQDMEAFFERYYVPENMAIVLVGDVDAATALPVLESNFGRWVRKGPGKALVSTRQPMQAAHSVDVPVPADPSVHLAWQLPAIGDKDRVALEVMDRLLLDGQTGMLSREIDNLGKGKGAGCNYDARREAGHYEITAELLNGQTHAEVKSALLAVVENLKAGKFSEEEVKAAATAIAVQAAMSADDPRGRVGTIANAYVNNMSWADAVAYPAAAQAITKQDVMRVAKQYLNDRFVTVNGVVKEFTAAKVPKPAITPVALKSDAHSPFADEVLAIRAPAELAPEVLRAKRDFAMISGKQGATITVAHPQSQLFSVSWQFEVGNEALPAVCVALDALERSGTRTMPTDAVRRQFQLLGAKVMHTCTPDEVTLNVTGLAANFEPTLKLHAQWLTDAAISADALTTAKKNEVTNLANSKNVPDELTDAAESFAFFGKRSPFLRTPDAVALQKFTVADATGALNGLTARKRITTYVGADLKKPALLQLGSGSVAATQQPWTLPVPKTNQVVAAAVPGVKSQITWTWTRPQARARDLMMWELGAFYFGSMNGLLFQEVREARGLAYSVGGYYSAGQRKQDDPAFGLFVSTQSDKTIDAMTTVLDIMKRDIDPNRFATAKASLLTDINSRRSLPADRKYMVTQWYRHGLQADPRLARRQAASKVSMAEFDAWVKEVVAQPYTAVVVGPQSAVGNDSLKKFGEVTTLDTTKLFSY